MFGNVAQPAKDRVTNVRDVIVWGIALMEVQVYIPDA
jgi:hypothetical protein